MKEIVKDIYGRLLAQQERLQSVKNKRYFQPLYDLPKKTVKKMLKQHIKLLLQQLPIRERCYEVIVQMLIDSATSISRIHRKRGGVRYSLICALQDTYRCACGCLQILGDNPTMTIYLFAVANFLDAAREKIKDK